jgi:hypothetical protein
MAPKTEIRNVNIVVNGKEVTNNIKSIGAEYKKAKNELAKLTIGSDQYNKKVAEVKKLKSILDQHRKTLGFVQSGWQKLKSGITTLLPALSLGTLVTGTKRLIEFTQAIKANRAEVKKLTDLTGPALDNATSRVTAIAEVYDKDFNQVLQAANNLSQQMNISFGESLGLIEKGFQAGADASGEFLDNVREYPAFFQEAGFNAEQFISTITKQTKSGIFSDKGVDAIKEATLSLREMTEPTREALEAIGIDADELSNKITTGQIKMSDAIALVSGKIAKLPAQSQAVGLALADIFKGAGEDAGVEFISTLSDINVELEDMIDNTDDLVIAQQNNIIATTQWNEAMLRMFGEGSALNKGWSGFKADFATGANDIATILNDSDLSFFEKLAGVLDKNARIIIAGAIQAEEAVEAEKQAYNLLNEQLVLQARNIGINLDLTALTNEQIQLLINQKKAQIEQERLLAKAEKERQEEAEKARKKWLKADEKLQNKIRSVREQLQLSQLTDQAKEIQAVNFKYAKLEEQAEGHADRLKEIEELKEQEIAAVNKKFADEKLKKRAEVEEQIQQMLLSGKDKEIAAVAKKFQDLIAVAEQFGFDTAELFEKLQEQIAEIEEKYIEDEEEGNLFQKIFGLDEEGWEDLQEKFDNIIAFADQASAAYSAYADLRRAQDNAEMKQFEKDQNSKKKLLEKQLEAGIISEEDFNNRVQQLDEQTDRKKAELMKEQAEREKNAAIFSAIINTAAAIIGFLANPSGIAGVALSALAAVTGALQIAAISAEPVPAFEKGGRIKKEGLILAGEGNKEEGILSNDTLTDPQLGPLANYILDQQQGINTPFPTSATESPDFGDVSRAVDFNNFQRAGGEFGTVINDNSVVTTTTAPTDNTLELILQQQQQLNEFLADPVNRQAYINYDKQIESDDEMRYLQELNNF